MITADPIAAGAAALNEAKAYLRIGFSEEDALLDRLLASSLELCERFTGQVVLVRSFEETLPASSAWTRLSRLPVRAISAVEAVVNGAAAALGTSDYAIDIDAGGHGWVRVLAPQTAKTIRVTYSAGLGEGWETVPEPLRQGIIRLASHLYTHRSGGEDAAPPAAVSALWRPYRRMRLG
jgi:uncharacterized phiE125 gp8 family phage protein